MEAHDPALHADDVALQSEVLGSFGFLRYMVEKSTESVLSLAGLVPGTAQMAQQKTHNDMQALWAHYNGITMCEHAKEMQLSPTYLPGVEKATVMGELTLLWEKPEDNLYAVTRVRPGKGHKAGPGGPPDDAPADDCPGLVRWLDHVQNLLHFLTAATTEHKPTEKAGSRMRAAPRIAFHHGMRDSTPRDKQRQRGQSTDRPGACHGCRQTVAQARTTRAHATGAGRPTTRKRARTDDS